MNKDETLALFAQGKEKWNEWVEPVLAEIGQSAQKL